MQVFFRATAGLAATCLLLSACSPPDVNPSGFVSPDLALRRQAEVGNGGTAQGPPIPLNFRGPESRVSLPADVTIGSGLFVNPGPATLSRGSEPLLTGADVTLDFSNIEIKDVLKNVLGDLLHVAYVIDPTVSGTMTLQTGRPIPRTAVIELLNNALQLTGVALVSGDGLYRAIPLASAARQVVAGATSGFVSRSITPRFVSAADLERGIEPMLPPGTSIKADPARNLLTISGSARSVADLIDQVATFDVDTLRGMSFALLPLVHGKARDVAADVTALLANSGRSMTEMVKVAPIERMNAVLVTSMQPAYIGRVRGWVERFDRGDGRSDQQLFVYRVQNGRAADLAQVLRQALGIERGDTSRAPPEQGSTPGSTEPAVPSDPLGLQATPSPPALGVTARADPLAGVNAASAGSTGGPDIRLTADVANNALVIAATAQDYTRIEAALQQLDVAPLQVLIEATIAEVTLSNALSLGLQYYFRSGNFVGINAPAIAAVTSLVRPSSVASTFPGFNFSSGGNFAFGDNNAGVVLTALDKLSTVRVLSSPNLLVLNNRTARLQVGDQVPIATQSSISTLTSTAQTTNSIQYRDTGVILSVTPRVNASGLVLLDMTEEVSDVSATTTSTLNSPTISQRRVTSSIAVHDGETIGLGGLIRDSRIDTNSGLPWLKDLPAVGFLFGLRSSSVTRTELIVLITPHVIRGRSDAAAATEELRAKLRQVSSRIPVPAR